MVKIILKSCKNLSENEISQIKNVFCSCFEVQGNVHKCLEHYFNSINNILLAFENNIIIAFQFYQYKNIANKKIHHFSLAGKIPSAPKSIQSLFGKYIIKSNLLNLFLPYSIYIAGVANSPKSYANMYKLRGICFPDVNNSLKDNPFKILYEKIAIELKMKDINSEGILINRMQNLGFKLIYKQSIGQNNSLLHKNYINYVKDYNNGIFTLIKINPWLDIPKYIFRLLVAKFNYSYNKEIKNV